MAQRLVLVDDTNSNIQYSGPWFAAQNTQLNTGNFGPPFQNTLHGVNVDASFSYSFSGSSVSVMGTSVTTNSSGSQDPTWECFVDNNSIGWRTVLQYAENSWVFCQNGQLQDGPHVLTVKVKVAHQNTFWFDQIQYLPSSSASLDQSLVRIDSSDSAVQYSSGWQGFGGIVDLTQTTGSTVTYSFSGTSLTFVGYLPPNFPLTTSSATYSIDGSSPSNFLVPNGSPELYNQVLFQTGQLSAGQHKVVVTYQGNSGTAPLALDYFVVQNAPSSSGSSPTGGNVLTLSPSSSTAGASSGGTGTTNSAASVKGTQTATNTASSDIPLSSHIPGETSAGAAGSISSSVSSSGSSSSGNSSDSTSTLGSTGSSTVTKMPLGAIIGGVLGGVILLLLLLILFLFIRKRGSQGAKRLSEKFHIGDSQNTVDPFTVPPNPPIPALQSDSYASEGKHLTSQPMATKFAQGRSPTSAQSTSRNLSSTSPPTDVSSSASGSGMPVLTPLRNPSSSSPATTSSPSVPDAASQTNLIDDTMTKAQEAETAQRSASPQAGDARFLRHQDSGIRLPPVRDSLVELPPLYTPG
ncbi:hypothetical protein BYT27DRAFT_7337774 [Phlegmacium glaucopus]|nr:hypothetical protein BYT27DRAFT_7337774 [Phlegmacium glaucopus]